MSHRKPLAGQQEFRFMAPARPRRPKLAVVRADPEDQPAESEAKPVTRRRLPKAG